MAQDKLSDFDDFFDFLSDALSVSEEEAFIIDDPELDKEVKDFFGITTKRFALEELKGNRRNAIDSVKLLKFICENNLLDNIEGRILLELSSLDNFTEGELKSILTKLDVDKICLSDLTGLTKEKIEMVAGKCFIDGDSLNSNETYDIETLGEIVNVLEEIKKSIPENATELEKFLTVYKAIGMSADYDNSGCRGHELSTEEGVHLTRSLKGVLLDGRAVCAGYSLALKYALQYVGIEAKRISGHAYLENEDGDHAWNQVKIDGRWYNTDLTWDYEDLREGKELKYCLKSDEFFSTEHVAGEMEDCEKCELSHPKDEVQIALGSLHCELDEYRDSFGKGYLNLGKEINQEDIVMKSTISVEDIAKMAGNASALMEQEAISVMVKEMEHEHQKSNQMEK